MRLIKETLKSNGLTVWVDEDGLNAGVDFLSKIGQAVVECHTFLSIVTQASVSSKYCKVDVIMFCIFPIVPYHRFNSSQAELVTLVELADHKESSLCLILD